MKKKLHIIHSYYRLNEIPLIKQSADGNDFAIEMFELGELS